MANRRFKYGSRPNFLTTSNDHKNCIPDGGFGSGRAENHGAIFQDCNREVGNKGYWPSDNCGKWNKNWSLPYIHGVSEHSKNDDDRMGRAKDHFNDDCENNSAGYNDPQGTENIWNSVREGDAFNLCKPHLMSYRSYGCYIGSTFDLDSQSNAGWPENCKDGYNYAARKVVPINPMGLQFSFQTEHEMDTGLKDATSKIRIHGIYAVLKRPSIYFGVEGSANEGWGHSFFGEAAPHLAELVNASSGYLTKSSTNGEANMSDYECEVPGRYKLLGGAGGPPHKKSWGGMTDGVRSADQSTRKVPDGWALGKYGTVYYEFSAKTKKKIAEEDWRPLGIIISCGGYNSNAFYSSSGSSYKMWDFNWIAYSPYSPCDGYTFDRINDEPVTINEKRVTKSLSNQRGTFKEY